MPLLGTKSNYLQSALTVFIFCRQVLKSSTWPRSTSSAWRATNRHMNNHIAISKQKWRNIRKRALSAGVLRKKSGRCFLSKWDCSWQVKQQWSVLQYGCWLNFCNLQIECNVKVAGTTCLKFNLENFLTLTRKACVQTNQQVPGMWVHKNRRRSIGSSRVNSYDVWLERSSSQQTLTSACKRFHLPNVYIVGKWLAHQTAGMVPCQSWLVGDAALSSGEASLSEKTVQRRSWM